MTKENFKNDAKRSKKHSKMTKSAFKIFLGNPVKNQAILTKRQKKIKMIFKCREIKEKNSF